MVEFRNIDLVRRAFLSHRLESETLLLYRNESLYIYLARLKRYALRQRMVSSSSSVKSMPQLTGAPAGEGPPDRGLPRPGRGLSAGGGSFGRGGAPAGGGPWPGGPAVACRQSS